MGNMSDDTRKRIDALEKQLSQTNAQIQDINARAKSAERKAETRRKIIVGAIAERHVRSNMTSAFARKLMALIDEYVIEDHNRALFDLQPLPPDEKARRLEHQKSEQKRRKDFDELL